MTTRGARELYLKEAAYNLFKLKAENVIPTDPNVIRLCGRRALDPLASRCMAAKTSNFSSLFRLKISNACQKRVDGVAHWLIYEITYKTDMARIREKNREWDLAPEGFEHFKC